MKKILSAMIITTLVSISAISFSGCTDITKSSDFNAYELKYLVNLTNTEESTIKDTMSSVQKSLNQRLKKFEVVNTSINASEEDGAHYLTIKFGTIDPIQDIKVALTQNDNLILKKRFTDESDYETEIKEHAEADLKNLIENDADFDITAQNAVSSDPERVAYSETDDWLYKQEVLDAFTETVFSLEPGEISKEIIEFQAQISPLAPSITVYGIVKLFDKRDKNYVKVSHILIPYKGALRSPEDETRTKEEAEIFANELLDRLNESEDFATLARENSSCSSAENGGILDTPAGSGGYVTAFEEAALALNEVGELTKVIETEFGYHIIKADKIIPAQQAKFGVIFYASHPTEWETLDFSPNYIQSVDVRYDEKYDPYVVMQFNTEGKEKLKEITEENMDSIIGIFAGVNLVTSFTVKEVNEDGIIKILSPTETAEAETLQDQLLNGNLAAPIILKDEQSIEN